MKPGKSQRKRPREGRGEGGEGRPDRSSRREEEEEEGGGWGGEDPPG